MGSYAIDFAQILLSFKYVVCFLVCGLCFYIYVKVFRRDPRLVSFAETVPGPPTPPVFGHGLDFFQNGVAGLEKMLGYSEKYGTLYRLWFGKHLALVISSAEDLQTIFLSSKMLEKPDMCESFSEMFGNCVFTVEGHSWRQQRKTLQPLYSTRALPSYEEDAKKIIRDYIKKIGERYLDGPEFDLWQWTPYLIFDILTKTHFDVELDTKEKNKLQFHLCIKTMVEAMFLQSLRPWFHIRFLRPLANWFYGVSLAQKKVAKFTNEIMSTNLPLLEEENHKNAGSSEEIPSQYKFLSATYGQIEEYNDLKRIQDEILVISAAATDTTAITLSTILLCLAIYPEIQNKVWEEIHDLYGDDDREATVEDLQRLPYLDLVMRETQRRFTPVPLIFRKVSEDSKIGNMIVPAGTALVISLIGIHNNPEYYKEPTKFDPNRFLPEEVEKRPKLSYVPFSAGTRNCAGMNFALLVIKLAVIEFLRAYRFDTSVKLEDIKLVIGFISISVNGYKVRITRRRPIRKETSCS